MKKIINGTESENDFWKRLFDEQFSVFDGGQKIIKHVTYSIWVKTFIQKLLDRRKLDLLYEIEEFIDDNKWTENNNYVCSYKGIKDLVDKIKQQ